MEEELRLYLSAREIPVSVIEDMKNEKLCNGPRILPKFQEATGFELEIVFKMEGGLELFLQSRHVSDELIAELKEQNINMETIKMMDMETLEKFIPKFGDRLAVLDFCNRTYPNKRKDSLLEKLREKLKNKEVREIDNDAPKLSKQKKLTRIVELGWLHFEQGRLVQVRTKQGGGTRKVSVKQDATKQDLMTIAKSLFFVDGVSNKGHVSEFDFTLSDFKCQEIYENVSVSEVFEATAITRLRFYITTKYKNKPSTVVTSSSTKNTQEENQLIDQDYNIDPIQLETGNRYLNKIDKPQSEDDDIISNAIRRSKLNLPPLLESSEDEIEFVRNIEDINTLPDDFVANFNPEYSKLGDEITLTLPSDGQLEEIFEESEMIDSSNSNSVFPILHRGNLLDEMIEQFVNIEINDQLEIEIYLPNGEKETAQNIGGVFRDVLSEFWQDFFNKYTVGVNAKVPLIRHDFDENKWISVAKILAKGWIDQKYYPVQLSKTFMERCIFGKCISDLTEDLLKYVSVMDCRLIATAIENFDEIDIDELLECLENLECKWKPSKDNIKQLIYDLAHKELIQKPMFIIDSWSTILNQIMTVEDFNRKYSIHRNLPRNILKKLEFDEDLNSVQQNTANYLKKFIRESEEKIICNFLRFVTGANMLIEETPIKVSFSLEECKNLRTPTAHTCSSLLILPSTYDSYTDFRHEFSSILNSNVWVMDII